MTMTLQEVMDTCDDWEKACDLLGFSYWSVNEGGGDVDVSLTTSQAHHLGIVRVRDDWKLKPIEEAFATQ